MPNTELPIELENQVVLMKKYVNFPQKKKMRDFLGYAGYFREKVKQMLRFSLNSMSLMCN